MAKITNRILVVDLEATCWDTLPPKGMQSEIIEIGVCSLAWGGKDWEIIGQDSILIRPVLSTVSPFCTELTTITQELLDQKGIDFYDACKRLEDIHSSRKVGWASWGDYDRLMFEKQCKMPSPRQRKQNWSRYPFGDTHWNMKNLYSLIRHLDKEIGMAEALKRENLTMVGTHHRGVDDAVNTARILQKILP